MSARAGTALLIALLLASSALAAYAQQRGRGGWRPYPMREGLPDRRGGFTFCRLLYTSVRAEANGHGWNTDYPVSDANFMLRLSQLTSADVSGWTDGEAGHAVVRATDETLFQCPFLFASDVGTARFSPEEAERLRTWLLKGGFLWVDDFWGERAWAYWEAEIGQILPEYAIRELPLSHPLLAGAFAVNAVPQVPSIQFWRRTGGATSERGAESATPTLRAITDEHGRVLVLMSHNTDIADGWEREGEDDRFFAAFSPDAYAVGLNVALWVMTH
ncbi:MAG TPA: DUF4159 domain-containing protein [Longimicrobiales bacterium]|nr:DUF4159 domain-containing protein [Longimicrobiales bacterium]